MLNQQDDEGQTALILAAKGGYPEVAKVLISNKANTELRDKFGRTALIVATIHGNPEVVRVLLAGGANIGGKDFNNLTAYSYARTLDRYEIMNLLNYATRNRPRRLLIQVAFIFRPGVTGLCPPGSFNVWKFLEMLFF